ncbi:MAG: hypothetical protein ACTHJR_12680 [Sphingomonas sp.]|uniref:hypothetical protein n=1 Tax=Sphingomonas sp. TaxID=28214 RepID=UPI003F800E00
MRTGAVEQPPTYEPYPDTYSYSDLVGESNIIKSVQIGSNKFPEISEKHDCDSNTLTSTTSMPSTDETTRGAGACMGFDGSFFDRGRVATGLLALVLAPLDGCATFSDDRPVTVSSTDEAGSLEITQSSVEAWSSAAPAIAPNFTMSGDTALTKVVPTTERINRQMLDTFMASLGIGLPTSSSTSVLTKKSVASDPAAGTDGTTTELTDTTNKGPGSSPTVSMATAGGASLPAGGDVSGALGIDPYVQYRGAYYLNQMVQLMNREVINAPLRRCYAPYLVKLKVAVIPYRSRLPYAIHARVGFFDDDSDNYEWLEPPAPKNAESGGTGKAEAVDGSTAKNPAEDQKSATTTAGAAANAGATATSTGCSIRLEPMVLPIIAADDMQVALKSKTLEVAQQLGLALNFMVSGVGGNVGASNLKQSLSAILSNDLSSALTVTRSSQNTLYMRIAPNNEPSGEPSMTGQTYDIAALVLVPLEYLNRKKASDPAVLFDLVTEFRDARTGGILSGPNEVRRAQILDRAVAPFLTADMARSWAALKAADKALVGERLSRASVSSSVIYLRAAMGCLPPADFPADNARENDPKALTLMISCARKFEERRARSLMTSIGSYVADNPIKGGTLTIPAPVDIDVPDQTLLVNDNGTSAASAVLLGVQGAASAKVQGSLKLKIAGTGETRGVPITSSILDPLARTLTLTFPTPISYKSDGEKWETNGNTLEMSFACDNEREWCPKLLADGNLVKTVNVQLITKPADVVGVSKVELTASSKKIIYDGATGTIQLTVGSLSAKETATLTITGGDIVSAADSVIGALAITSDGVVVPKSGRLTLNLNNLTGEDVTFKVNAKIGTKTTGFATVTLPLALKAKPAGDK